MYEILSRKTKPLARNDDDKKTHDAFKTPRRGNLKLETEDLNAPHILETGPLNKGLKQLFWSEAYYILYIMCTPINVNQLFNCREGE